MRVDDLTTETKRFVLDVLILLLRWVRIEIELGAGES